MRLYKGLVMFACIVGLTGVFTGCSIIKSTDVTKQTKDNNEESREMRDFTNMTLSGITYFCQNGMVNGADCSIELSEKELIYAKVFHIDEKEDIYEYREKEHEAISEEQWKQASEAVMALVPLLEGIPKSNEDAGNQVFQATDGPYAEELCLTWRNVEGVEERYRYYIPQDRRMITLIDILKEIADPVGREIIYYEAPTLVGIYFYDEGNGLTKKEAFSYQMTNIAKEAEPAMWMLYASYEEDGETKHFSEEISADEWPKVQALCDELQVESLPQNLRDSKKSMTLYFSDQGQKKVLPDEDTLKALREYFEKLVYELQE